MPTMLGSHRIKPAQSYDIRVVLAAEGVRIAGLSCLVWSRMSRRG